MTLCDKVVCPELGLIPDKTLTPRDEIPVFVNTGVVDYFKWSFVIDKWYLDVK